MKQGLSLLEEQKDEHARVAEHLSNRRVGSIASTTQSDLLRQRFWVLVAPHWNCRASVSIRHLIGAPRLAVHGSCLCRGPGLGVWPHQSVTEPGRRAQATVLLSDQPHRLAAGTDRARSALGFWEPVERGF